MSLSMTAARAGNMGDPGLFGFIGSALGAIGKTAVGVAGGFATGGLAGAILGGTRAATAALGGPKTIKQAKASNIVSIALQKPPLAISQTRTGMFGGSTPAMPPLQAGSGFYAGPGGVAVGQYNMAPAGAAPAAGSAAIAACGLKGYHMNKTTYCTHAGWVAKGSKCVRNRRRNPLNPRALSRAMSRVASAQRAVKAIQLFAGAPARAAAKGKGKLRRGRGRCGCK